MIGYLFVPALIIGIGASRTASVTESERSNQTLGTFDKDHSSVNVSNGTSGLTEHELIKTENGLQKNRTFEVIPQDDERFQETEDELVVGHCKDNMLDQHSHEICGVDFYAKMLAISLEDRCVMENIVRPYYELTKCLEDLSTLVGCFYPNPSVQDYFLHIHSYFFQNCSTDALPIEDAPQWLVVALTLIPVSFIPILVYVVVWKSKVQK